LPTPGFNSNGQDQAALEPQLVFLTFVDQQSNVAQARVNDAYQIDDTMSWFIAGRGGEHDLKFGVQYEYVGARSTAQDNLNGTFFFDRTRRSTRRIRRPIRNGCRFACPGRSMPTRRRTSARRSRRTSGGSQRARRSAWGSATTSKCSRSTSVTTRRFPIPRPIRSDKNNLSPRVGLTYDLTGNGKSVARGGFGRFYDKTHFELISSDSSPAGVFLDSFHGLLPDQQRRPGTVHRRHCRPRPMLAGGPTGQPRPARASAIPPASAEQERRKRHARQSGSHHPVLGFRSRAGL
jgi:hypothetical protein